MDWGLISFSKDKRSYFRQRTLWSIPFYIFAIIINLILRFAWASNIIPMFRQLHSSYLVLMVELAEVIRRAIWNLLRI